MKANFHFNFEEPNRENLTTINQFLDAHPCCNVSMNAKVVLCHTTEYDRNEKIIGDNWWTSISEIDLDENDEDTGTHTWQIEQLVISDKTNLSDFIDLWRKQHRDFVVREVQTTSFTTDEKKTILILYHT